jgi:hypothetical protein
MADIDVSDYIDELSDDELRREVERRKLEPSDMLQEAYSALVAGRVQDGITILERALFPTHLSKEACLWRYHQRMGTL